MTSDICHVSHMSLVILIENFFDFARQGTYWAVEYLLKSGLDVFPLFGPDHDVYFLDVEALPQQLLQTHLPQVSCGSCQEYGRTRVEVDDFAGFRVGEDHVGGGDVAALAFHTLVHRV
jgi:hypothetical protein